MTRLRAAGLAGLLSFVIAACSSSSGTSASPTPSPMPSPTPTAAASSAVSGFPFPSLGNSDKELEALIPDQIGGVTLQKFSMRGNEFMSSSNADPESVAFLNALGVQPSDIGVAFGFGFSADAQAAVGMFVFRANGANQAQLLSVFKDASNQNRDTPLTWSTESLGGKSVEVATDPEQQGAKLYLYARDDILFLFSATSDDQVSDALGKLP